MNDPNIGKLQELVKIARDGAQFYDHAAQQAIRPSLKATFQSQALAKRQLVDDLSSSLESMGASTPGNGTALGSLHQVYAEIRAKLASNDEKIYVAELEEAEDRLLDHFIDAIGECQDPRTVNLLRRHLADVRDSHDQMRALKRTLAA